MLPFFWAFKITSLSLQSVSLPKRKFWEDEQSSEHDIFRVYRRTYWIFHKQNVDFKSSQQLFAFEVMYAELIKMKLRCWDASKYKQSIGLGEESTGLDFATVCHFPGRYHYTDLKSRQKVIKQELFWSTLRSSCSLVLKLFWTLGFLFSAMTASMWSDTCKIISLKKVCCSKAFQKYAF